MAKLYRDSEFSNPVSIRISSIDSLAITMMSLNELNGSIALNWYMNHYGDNTYIITNSVNSNIVTTTSPSFSMKELATGTAVDVTITATSPLWKSMTAVTYKLVATANGIGVYAIGTTFKIS